MVSIKSIKKKEGRKKEGIEVRALIFKCWGAGRGVTTGNRGWMMCFYLTSVWTKRSPAFSSFCFFSHYHFLFPHFPPLFPFLFKDWQGARAPFTKRIMFPDNENRAVLPAPLPLPSPHRASSPLRHRWFEGVMNIQLKETNAHMISLGFITPPIPPHKCTNKVSCKLKSPHFYCCMRFQIFAANIRRAVVWNQTQQRNIMKHW